MAQAGNVAVPGAAREHFVPSSVVSSSSSQASEGTATAAVRLEVNRTRKEGRKRSARLKRKESSAVDEDGDDYSGSDTEWGVGVAGVEGTSVTSLRRGGGGSCTTISIRGGIEIDVLADDNLAVAEEGSASKSMINNNGLHARRLSPKQAGAGSGSGGSKAHRPLALG